MDVNSARTRKAMGRPWPTGHESDERQARPRLRDLSEVTRRGIRPRRILVIEDEPDIASTMRTALTLSGHSVDVASNGEDGICRALRTLPDVILSDIGLPGASDGLVVAETLRASGLFASTYMMAITGSSGADDVKRALSAGFDLHMAKPVDIRALLRIIAEHMADGDP